jgi:hypothetical protein
MLTPATKPPGEPAAPHSLCRPGQRGPSPQPRIEYRLSSVCGSGCGSACGISRPRVSLVAVRDLASRHFSTSLPQPFRQLSGVRSESRCGTHCGTRCGSHYGSRCPSSGCRVSLMVVRDSGGRAVLTSLPPVTVTVRRLCSRRAQVVSSWLVVGFPGSRGVSCLHPTRLPDARMRCRDVPARQPHRHGRWTAERPPNDSGITAYRQEARLIRVRREHRSPFGLWSTSPAGLPGQGLEIPTGVCSDRPPG